MAVKRMFLDPSRCIGCRSCIAACRECDTHKGETMIFIDYLDRGNTVGTSPSLCMHCEEPLAPCAQVCPAQAILVSSDGVVHQADVTRCINIRNCVYVCPFGIPKFDVAGHYMRKCNLCYDRTVAGLPPMCSSVCPTEAIFYGTYDEWIAAGRGQQGARPVNVFYFGQQRLRTRNYVVMRQEQDALDLMAVAEAVTLGDFPDLPEPTANRDSAPWEEASEAGIPERYAPAVPWAPRVAPSDPATPPPSHEPERSTKPRAPERTPVS